MDDLEKRDGGKTRRRRGDRLRGRRSEGGSGGGGGGGGRNWVEREGWRRWEATEGRKLLFYWSKLGRKREKVGAVGGEGVKFGTIRRQG